MIRKLVLGAAIMLAGLGGMAGAAAAAPAHMAAASPQSATLTSVAVPDTNDCGLPTQADPGSHFVGSYSSCLLCEIVAQLETNPPYIYYCTYNPSNGLTDLHYDPPF